jgi:hypothetical protein
LGQTAPRENISVVRSRPALLEVASCAAGHLFGSRSLQVKKRSTCVALFGERSWAGWGRIKRLAPTGWGEDGALAIVIVFGRPSGQSCSNDVNVTEWPSTAAVVVCLKAKQCRGPLCSSPRLHRACAFRGNELLGEILDVGQGIPWLTAHREQISDGAMHRGRRGAGQWGSSMLGLR